MRTINELDHCVDCVRLGHEVEQGAQRYSLLIWMAKLDGVALLVIVDTVSKVKAMECDAHLGDKDVDDHHAH